jgi:hypothetical protein
MCRLARDESAYRARHERLLALIKRLEVNCEAALSANANNSSQNLAWELTSTFQVSANVFPDKIQ